MDDRNSCEFCMEMNGTPSARFYQMYLGLTESRVVAESSSFVAIPTLGQLFTGSMLVLPKRHVESLAWLNPSEIHELELFRRPMQERLCHFGVPFVYEHGANSCSGSGCGIYHAHLHIVPLPKTLDATALCSSKGSRSSSFIEALSKLRGTPEYLLFEDAAGQIVFTLPEVEGVLRFESQQVRKQLARHFGLDKSWDWREFKEPEASVMTTIQFFEESRVSNSCTN